MKRLYLVRHAKSDWGRPGLADFDRPLNKRGKKDAPLMGKYLKSVWQIEPDLILCSTAKRAKSTAKRLLKAFDYPKNQIAWHERIYSGDADDVLGLIRRVDNGCGQVMLIGHNPDITTLINELTNADIFDVPTCGVAGIDLDIDAWEDIVSGNLVFFEVPKAIDS
jgi:phosphohistidine phosphatase